MKGFLSILAGCGLCLLPLPAQFSLPALDRELDRLGNQLFLESPDGKLFVQASFQLDFWLHYADGNGGPPGFFFVTKGRDWEFSPRLTGRFDAFFGEKLSLHSKVRWDDGVHPGVGAVYGDHTEVRVDEGFIKWVPTPSITLQVGQFTPVFGNFMARQDSWDMGTVNYPMVYENVTSVTDQLVPADADAFAQRRNQPDNKKEWIPIIWAPLYTQGVSVFGTVENLQYSLNFTAHASSSRGVVWNNIDFEYPTWSGRLGYRFGPQTTLGINASQGPYFRTDATNRLPAGEDPSDYLQTLVGLDFQWAHRDWEVWAELYLNRFEVPNTAESADSLSYYIEARRQLAPKWWVAARWNQELHSKINTPSGPQDWDNDVYRVDLTLGHRFIRHGQIKFQYSYQNQDALFQNGRHFIVTEFTLRL